MPPASHLLRGYHLNVASSVCQSLFLIFRSGDVEQLNDHIGQLTIIVNVMKRSLNYSPEGFLLVDQRQSDINTASISQSSRTSPPSVSDIDEPQSETLVSQTASDPSAPAPSSHAENYHAFRPYDRSSPSSSDKSAQSMGDKQCNASRDKSPPSSRDKSPYPSYQQPHKPSSYNSQQSLGNCTISSSDKNSQSSLQSPAHLRQIPTPIKRRKSRRAVYSGRVGVAADIHRSHTSTGAESTLCKSS